MNAIINDFLLKTELIFVLDGVKTTAGNIYFKNNFLLTDLLFKSVFILV